MKQTDWKDVYSPVPERFHQALHDAAHGVREDKTVRQKKTWILALALCLLLVGGTAIALVNHYSVRQFQAGGTASDAFEKHIIELDQTYENEFITLTVGDAVFDGTNIAVAMDINDKGAGPVYLYPKLTGVCNGRTLDIDVVGMRGDFMSGFLFPSLEETSLDGQYGFEAVLYEDYADADVEWTLTVDVLAPNYPVENAEDPAADQTRAEFEAYMQTFRDAYDEKRIAATHGDSLVEYAVMLPAPEGVTDEDFFAMRLNEQLEKSGAFRRIDTIECAFTAPLPELLYENVGEGLTYSGDGFEFVFGGMHVSFMTVDYRYELRYPEKLEDENIGSLANYQLYDQDGTELYASGSRVHEETLADGTWVVSCEGTATYQGETPTEIRFVPWPHELEGPDMAEGLTIPLVDGAGD